MKNEDLAELLKILREAGVDEFECGWEDFKVKFDPALRGRTVAFPPDFEQLNKEQAMERFGTVNKDDDSLLDWSV